MARIVRNQPEGVARRTGMRPDGVDGIVAVFEQMLDDAEHPGAQLAVYRDGELVVELAGGTNADGTALGTDSLLCILSTSKALTATLLHTLRDRGVFDYDDPVAAHWPEFAKNGKESITVGQVLSHRAGMADADSIVSWFTPGIGGFLDWEHFDEPGAVAEMMEAQTPIWTPGTACGYHAFSYGHVLNELALRWHGRSIGDLMRTELCEPLGVENVWIGLPEEEYGRLSPLTPVDGVDDRWRAGFDRARQVDYRTPAGGEVNFFNSYEILRVCLAGSNGVACAGDLARVMNILAFEGTFDGHRFFSADTFARAVTPTNNPEDHDRVLGPVRWGLGFTVGDSGGLYGTTPSPRACGHAGGGTSVAWADPDRRLAVAFLPNGSRSWEATHHRYRRIGDAVLGACG